MIMYLHRAKKILLTYSPEVKKRKKKRECLDIPTLPQTHSPWMGTFQSSICTISVILNLKNINHNQRIFQISHEIHIVKEMPVREFNTT